MTRAAIVNITMFSDEPPSLIRRRPARLALSRSRQIETTRFARFSSSNRRFLLVEPHGGRIRIECSTQIAAGRDGRTTKDRRRNGRTVCAERKWRGVLHQRYSVANAARPRRRAASYRTVTEQRARNSRRRIFTLIAERPRPELPGLRSQLVDGCRSLRSAPSAAPAAIVRATALSAGCCSPRVPEFRHAGCAASIRR